MRARLLAGALVLGLTACSGSSSPSPAVPQSVTGQISGNANTNGLLTRIVGIGDSLTAGEQSNGLLGANISPNPLGATSPFPIIPNTQGKGYYARIWSQANGGADPLNPATSPLPLIAPPGLGQLLVPTTSGGLTSITADPCGGPGAAAQSFSTALSIRINPGTTPLDLGVPGQTVHQALYQIAPTAPCNGSALPSPFNSLASLLQAANLNFYPILANFGPGKSQVQDAISVRPTLAIVNLGSNDLLEYLFSNGGVGPTDPGSIEADMEQIIRTLHGVGAQVVVANLVDVENAPQFARVSALQQLFVANGVPAALAPSVTAAVQQFLQQQLGLGQNGLLTLTGLNKLNIALRAGLLGGVGVAAALAQANFTAGDYVSDAVAMNGASLNAAYNTQIATAAQRAGATLVDVHQLFVNVLQNGYPLPGNPKCCSLAFGGGFLSLDGLHPSDTGYAVLANLFISTIDQAFNVNIPQLTPAQITAINATDLYSPH